ncbi:MAG: hypothetical protein BWY99_01656 [Synergistetes bacterium ADurb.BinA166]|nr:MAG: hypothetical protein BWY99_01656 [Synergistetes bacterium ADurb.BinA166]
MSDAVVCHNWKCFLKHGQPATCLREADRSYDMDFTDVKPGAFIHWCASCGPKETAIRTAFENFIHASPENFEKASAVVNEARQKDRS